MMKKETTDRHTNKIIERRAVCDATGECDRCRPHRGENTEKRPRRSWKFFRKTKFKELS